MARPSRQRFKESAFGGDDPLGLSRPAFSGQHRPFKGPLSQANARDGG